MALIYSLILGLLFASVTLIISHEPPSLLQKRFSKTSVKKESFLNQFMKNFVEALRPISEKNTQTANFISKTKKLLLQAGYASTEDDIIKYESKKVASIILVSVVGLFVLVMLFSLEMLIGYIILLYLVYKWPEVKLKKEIKARQKEFMRYLPDAVDLLAICVQAGLGLDASFSKVAEEFAITSPTIAVEFERLNNDILSGLNRQDAYKNLVLRNDNPDLQSFVALLIQTDRLGTSITQSLEAFCDSLRTKKRQRIEELSQQASTKMTVPMVLFMLPAIFIIIMFPALQKITSNLGGM